VSRDAPVDVQFGQLIEETELELAKRSKFYKMIITVGRRDTRLVIVFRERLVRHFYHLFGPDSGRIAEKTGLSRQYVSSKLSSFRDTKMTTGELEAVQTAVATVERDFTKDGVSGILGKLDALSTLSWNELMRRLVEEPELFESRDLVYLFRSVLEQFNQMVDRIRTADPNSTAKFLTTEDAKTAITANRGLLERIEEPGKTTGLKVVGKAE
jgi:hypothetical protein